MVETKAKFRVHLKESVQERLEKPFDKLTYNQQSKEMTRFYVQQILSIIAPGLIPEDEEDLEGCLVDERYDCGVDFISRTEGRVLIIQGKYHGPDKHEKEADFTHFCEVLKRIHPSSGSQMNEKLRDAVRDIAWEKDWFDLYFITLGKVGDGIKKRAQEPPAIPSKFRDVETRVNLELLDETGVNQRFREALSAGEGVEDEVRVRFCANEDQPPWLVVEGPSKRLSYVGRVSGAEIAEVFRPHQYRLFANNIRDYVGDTMTNKEIISTALSRPDEFFFFNNGISAVTTSIRAEEDEGALYCRRFSVINGAQTVRSLAKAQLKNPAALRDVNVLIRISNYSLGKEPEFLQDVTRYNNTQNAVKVSDFRSNDPVQRDLARRFAELRGGTKPFLYKNKRRVERTTTKIQIGMEGFAKTIHAFRYGPDDVCGGTGYLFSVSEDGGYVKLFGDDEGIWARLTDDQFRLLAGTWFLCEQVRDNWSDIKQSVADDPQKADVKGALERRWMVFFAVGELLRIIYAARGEDLDSDIRKLYKPNWADRESLVKTLRRLTEMACTALQNAYRKAVGSGIIHRNWFRSTDTLKDIRAELSAIPVYLGEENLPLLR